MDLKCPVCKSGQVSFIASIGAPGKGEHWECGNCGTQLINIYGGLKRYEDVDVECLVMDESEVY